MRNPVPGKAAVISVLLVTLALIALQPLSAQDTSLSLEEIALLDRLEAAVAMTQIDIKSYSSSISETENQNLTIILGGAELPMNESTEFDALGTFILGENPNGFGRAQVAFAATEQGAETSFVMQAEIRYVDGVLYVNAAYTESTGDVPPLKEGWVEVEDVENHPELELLQLADFLDEFDTEEDNQLARNIKVLKRAATSVALDSGELNDVLVDFITVTLGWDGVVEILQEEDPEGFDPNDPIMTLFGEQLAGQDDLFTIILALDENEHIVGTNMATTLTLADVDLSTIDDNVPPETFLNMVITLEELSVVGEINEAFEPATAP